MTNNIPIIKIKESIILNKLSHYKLLNNSRRLGSYGECKMACSENNDKETYVIKELILENFKNLINKEKLENEIRWYKLFNKTLNTDNLINLKEIIQTKSRIYMVFEDFYENYSSFYKKYSPLYNVIELSLEILINLNKLNDLNMHQNKNVIKIERDYYFLLKYVFLAKLVCYIIKEVVLMIQEIYSNQNDVSLKLYKRYNINWNNFMINLNLDSIKEVCDMYIKNINNKNKDSEYNTSDDNKNENPKPNTLEDFVFLTNTDNLFKKLVKIKFVDFGISDGILNEKLMHPFGIPFTSSPEYLNSLYRESKEKKNFKENSEIKIIPLNDEKQIVWSVGILIYQLLFNTNPLGENKESIISNLKTSNKSKTVIFDKYKKKSGVLQIKDKKYTGINILKILHTFMKDQFQIDEKNKSEYKVFYKIFFISCILKFLLSKLIEILENCFKFEQDERISLKDLTDLANSLTKITLTENKLVGVEMLKYDVSTNDDKLIYDTFINSDIISKMSNLSEISKNYEDNININNNKVSVFENTSNQSLDLSIGKISSFDESIKEVTKINVIEEEKKRNFNDNNDDNNSFKTEFESIKIDKKHNLDLNKDEERNHKDDIIDKNRPYDGNTELSSKNQNDLKSEYIIQNTTKTTKFVKKKDNMILKILHSQYEKFEGNTDKITEEIPFIKEYPPSLTLAILYIGPNEDFNQLYPYIPETLLQINKEIYEEFKNDINSLHEQLKEIEINYNLSEEFLRKCLKNPENETNQTISCFVGRLQETGFAIYKKDIGEARKNYKKCKNEKKEIKGIGIQNFSRLHLNFR